MPTCKKILITGGSGFIGGSLARFLRLNNTNYEYFVPSSNELNLLEEDRVRNCLTEISPDIIIHCAAALPSKFGWIESGILTQQMDRNLITALNYLNQKPKVIYFSGTSLYKNIGDLLTESSEIKATNHYLAAKQVGEQLVMMNLKNFVICRVSAPYGIGQKIETVIHLFILKAVRNEPITLFQNGDRVQNFTHIEDVEIFIEKCMNSNKVGIYNVASKESVTMRFLSKLIIELSKSKSEVISLNQADKDSTKALNISISKAEKDFQWKPRKSLQEGIKELVNASSNYI